MRRFFWPGLVVLLGCAPKNIAKSVCHSEMLATGEPWACTVSGERIEQASSIAFDSESRNQVAQVKLSLKVAKGTLRVGYRDLQGNPLQLTLTPQTPASLEWQTRMHRDRRSFTLTFEPIGGAVEGLDGTVNYSTP